MSFVDVSIQFQAEVTEENPGAASSIVPQERPNHPYLEEMRAILSKFTMKRSSRNACTWGGIPLTKCW